MQHAPGGGLHRGAGAKLPHRVSGVHGGDKCGADINLEYLLKDVEEEVCAPVQDEVCTTQYEEECRTEPGECSAQEETECRIELQTNLREVSSFTITEKALVGAFSVIVKSSRTFI